MSAHSPLDTLNELARTRLDGAVRRLGVLQSAQVSASQKLDQLLQYRRDYEEQLQTLMQEGLSSSQWRNYQSFLGTLDSAIDQQRAVTTQAASRLDHGRSDWQHSKRRLNAFEALADRLLQRKLMAESRRDQRDTDERASRKFFDRAIQPTT